MMLSFRDI